MSSVDGRKHVVLGNEYDAQLRNHLLDVLREMGATFGDRWSGVVGSQEVQAMEVDLGGHLIVIEAETYIGLTIAGDANVIDDIAARVHQRTAATED